MSRLIARVADKVRGQPHAQPPRPAPVPQPVGVASKPAATAPVAPVAPKPAAAAPPRPSGFAAAARKASQSGVSTATMLRETATEAEEHEPAAAPVAVVPPAVQVVGALQHDAEVRRADDGTPYHGPVDNESARARAAGKRLDIDRNECIGCGTCVEHIDTVFFLKGDEGKAYVLAQDGAMDAIQDAIDACPVTCISWQES